MIKKSKCVCKCHFQRHPQSVTITDATGMKTVASHLHRRKAEGIRGPEAEGSQRPENGECATISDTGFLYSLTVRHATLMPREWAWKAPDLRLFRKTDLSKADFFRQFSAGKTKTSDFSSGKFQGFAPKVRMFCLKKSDVFMSLFCCFHPFFGLSRIKFRDFHHKNSN